MKPQYSPTDIQNMRNMCFNMAKHFLYSIDNEVTSYNPYKITRLAEEYLQSYIQAGVTYEELDKFYDISDYAGLMPKDED